MDYANGKIYKLVSPHTTKVYVGSTCSTLTKRKASHKSDYTRWKKGKRYKVMSFDLYDNGIDDVDIVLVEKFPCADKMELHKRERYWIEKLDCCNRMIPMRTHAEYYQDNIEKIKARHKAYREANIEKEKMRHKVYEEANKEMIKVKKKAYREANIEKIKVKKKAYQEKNKEHIARRVTCECGSVIRHDNTTNHKKTKKHKSFMETK